MGNSATQCGYGCQMPSMVAAWRRQWSEQGTTDPLAPFGVVTLAAGGSEGHDSAMAGMRWSQTANYGVLPNAAMPNTFLAHAYDLGDPMDNLHAPCVNASSGLTNKSAFGPAGPCVWPPATAWNVKVRPMRDVVFENKAPSFMGGIHPRFKHEVGRRLALAYRGTVGPTLSGCGVVSGGDRGADRGGKSPLGSAAAVVGATATAIEVSFNSTLLGGDALLLQWAHDDQRYNMSTWNSDDASTMMVCLSPASSSSSSSSSSSPPPPSPSCLTDASMWVATPLLPGSAPHKLKADLRGLLKEGQSVLAIRYGWPISQSGGDTCCPSRVVSQGTTPCVPGSCPIITANTALPANPFYADITKGGKCKCMAPQQCDE